MFREMHLKKNSLFRSRDDLEIRLCIYMFFFVAECGYSLVENSVSILLGKLFKFNLIDICMRYVCIQFYLSSTSLYLALHKQIYLSKHNDVNIKYTLLMHFTIGGTYITNGVRLYGAFRSFRL